jgi:lipid-binding SYLF domain-containing protein
MSYINLRTCIAAACLLILAGCTNIEKTVQQTGSDIKQRFAVSERTAIETLAAAKANSASLGALEQASVAQIVFPKALKGGFLFGANYSEGFVVKDRKAIARVRMTGGNIGPQIGGQQYSQVSYVMTQNRLKSILNGTNFEILGTVSYAAQGVSKTQVVTTQARLSEIHTHIFNQTGYLAGITFDGIVYSVIQRY